MIRRVPLDNPPTPRQIIGHHAVIEKSICLYYSPKNPSFSELSALSTAKEVRASHDERLEEARAASALTLLAAIEASFRVDYLQRNYLSKKDDLSRAFRALYKEKQQRVSLSDDILQAWLDHSDVTRALVGNIRAAFKYRDWLAHGRYWVPTLVNRPGRKVDSIGGKAVQGVGPCPLVVPPCPSALVRKRKSNRSPCPVPAAWVTAWCSAPKLFCPVGKESLTW